MSDQNTSSPSVSPNARMEIVYRPINWFKEYGKNPRKNDAVVDRMCASISEFGFAVAMLCRSDGGIVDGHLRFKGAKKLGLLDLPVVLCDQWTDAQMKAFRIMVNRSVAWAEWDVGLLGSELLDLKALDFDLNLTGFDKNEVANLLEGLSAQEGLTDQDAVPELPPTPTSAQGDLWILGNHKLYVGDATDQSDVANLMAGEAADLVFTDPPYNVDYQGYTAEHLKILGDRMTDEQFKQFLESAFRSCRSVVKSGASLYICHSSSWQREFQNALESAGFEIRCQVIWCKDRFAWGFGRYKFRHEPMFYAHVAGEKDPWYGDKTQSTVWELQKPSANKLHPTMKPVELVERALQNSSKTGDAVVDLFGGSGSTLIACERRNRRARLMEMDPKYADVIVQRWEEYVGQHGVLDGDGRTFGEIKEERAALGTP